jgi:hypothetical protein
MNEILALLTILLNGSEKVISYRLQTGSRNIVGESNPLARFAIRRFGPVLSHASFFFLTIVVVCLTYIFTSFSSVAVLCLWLELISTVVVFLNNWVLGMLYCK